MAQTSETSETPNKTHVLNFFYDNEDSSALTVLVNDVRFHIIVNPKDLQKSRDKPLYYEYLDKISALREAEEREEKAAEEAQSKSLNGKKLHSGSSDSGIDVTAYDEDDNASDQDQDSGSAGVELRNWILSAFGDITEQYAPPDREPEESTLYDWYHGPTYFYNMTISSGALTPELLETTDDLTQRIDALVPRMKMPKYIQEYPIPWLNANDLTVNSEVSFPEPAHPGKVTHTEMGEVYFFKPVVADQPGSTKREIQILRQLEELNLDIKAPRLMGFVSYNNSKTEAMGLLLSHIASPKPLTTLLSPSVPASLRETWAQKSKTYVQTLHDHDIIWGDAKADNFMVDAEDELWIIDFGGSWTEGWVDPEVAETREGDDMGLEKVVAALEDPDRNTFDPKALESESESEEGDVSAPREPIETASGLFVTERRPEDDEDQGGSASKRKRGDDDEEEEEEGVRKKSKGDESKHGYTPEED
ncbi:hypothetical protein NX059_004523 [Plenodomus lindquistii]|nr:hypothetical protein NX059_004523 [Plenodomus lindquistii]